MKTLNISSIMLRWFARLRLNSSSRVRRRFPTSAHSFKSLFTPQQGVRSHSAKVYPPSPFPRASRRTVASEADPSQPTRQKVKNISNDPQDRTFGPSRRSLRPAPFESERGTCCGSQCRVFRRKTSVLFARKCFRVSLGRMSIRQQLQPEPQPKPAQTCVYY